jgi:hypothetical protein
LSCVYVPESLRRKRTACAGSRMSPRNAVGMSERRRAPGV